MEVNRMKKMILMLFAIILAFAALPFGSTNAELADGKYSIPYQVNKSGSSSASIANDYFLKPATLVKKDGMMYVQLTLKHSSEFVKFESPSGGNKVVQTDTANDQRTVQFNISSLSKPQNVDVRIEIPEADYFHNYKIDFIWSENNAHLIESYAKAAEVKPAATKQAEVKQTTATKVTEEKPATTKQEEIKQTTPKSTEVKPAATKSTDEKVATTAKSTDTQKIKDGQANSTKVEEVKVEEQKSKDVKDEAKAEAVKEETTKDEASKTIEGEKEEKIEGESTAKTTALAESAATDTAKESVSSTSNSTGLIIIVVLVIMIAGAGLLFFRKSKVA